MHGGKLPKAQSGELFRIFQSVKAPLQEQPPTDERGFFALSCYSRTFVDVIAFQQDYFTRYSLMCIKLRACLRAAFRGEEITTGGRVPKNTSGICDRKLYRDLNIFNSELDTFLNEIKLPKHALALLLVRYQRYDACLA